MGFLKFCFRIILVLSAWLLFLEYAPIFLDINPIAYKVEIPEKFEKELAYNERLSAAEKLFEGKIIGPESLAVHEGSIYTGLATGELIKIDGNKYSVVAKPEKSKFLGLRFDKKGLLYGCSPDYGLCSIDVKSGKVINLLPFGKEINGGKIHFLDDLDIDDNGIIYMSDASTRWTIENFLYMLIEHDNSGRVLTYDTKNGGKTSVLVDNLHFPNGIQVTHDGSGLLITELLKCRILKYHLKGPKKGELEVFATLPGEPDNIRPSKSGGYWVALLSARNATSKTVFDNLSEYPLFRKYFARMTHAIGSTLEYVDSFWPSSILHEYSKTIKSAYYTLGFMFKSCLIVELNEKGHIVQSLHSSDLSMCSISEVQEKDGSLFLGSFNYPFLRKIKL